MYWCIQDNILDIGVSLLEDTTVSENDCRQIDDCLVTSDSSFQDDIVRTSEDNFQHNNHHTVIIISSGLVV